MHHPIRLMVGLGNPGPEYADTRHNAGAWFLAQLARQWQTNLRFENKFHGQLGSCLFGAHKLWLLIPTTFMNLSGQAVSAVCHFYQIPAEAVLVAHDELDFPAGTVRLKQGGGHGGHNGLRDIMHHLNTDGFYRLRLGIGHPGHRNQVHDYVLNRPSKHDHALILEAIEQAITLVPELMTGAIEKAMQQLHTDKP